MFVNIWRENKDVYMYTGESGPLYAANSKIGLETQQNKQIIFCNIFEIESVHN